MNHKIFLVFLLHLQLLIPVLCKIPSNNGDKTYLVLEQGDIHPANETLIGISTTDWSKFAYIQINHRILPGLLKPFYSPLDDILYQVKSELYTTFLNFLESTGNLDTSYHHLSLPAEKQEVLLPPNANYIILKGFRILWQYGRWALQYLILMGITLMPNAGIIVACSMIPVIVASFWLPPYIDPISLTN